MSTDNIREALQSPFTRDWVRDALFAALACDPIDSAHDAEWLAKLLRERADGMLGKHK